MEVWIRKNNEENFDLFYIYTEIFASNFAASKGVLDFTLTNQRRNEFLPSEKSFRPITNHGLSQ